ncbi:MAG: tetratricopeptide repeat protein [Pseudomonadota bacterium]|nr:tetratricopeptide repeat protein [Pseudomonadota bacterium]
MTMRTQCLMAASLLFLTQAAFADDYAAAFKAKRYQDVERMANAALAIDPRDPRALRAKADALLSTAPDTRLDEALKLAEQCVAAHPKESICHEALGNVLGTKALNAGIFSAMGYAGKIRDAFRTAVDLDPANVSAKFSLAQYYLAAPGIVGGGVDKAQALAAETGKTNPAAASVLLAMIDVQNDDLGKAEGRALSFAPSKVDDLANQQRDVWWSIGQSYVQTKKFTDADRVFRTMQTRYPDSELGAYGLARTLQEQGQHSNALPLFEQATTLAPRAVIYYRMAQSLQATHADATASAAYTRALALRPALGKKMREDAVKQVKLLKN